MIYGGGDRIGSCFDAVFPGGGIRLSYHSPATALIFGRFRVWSFCLLKNHMRLVTWRTAYCAHVTIFKRGFGRYTDKSTPFKDVRAKHFYKIHFFIVLLQTNNKSLFSELNEIGVNEFVSQIKRVENYPGFEKSTFVTRQCLNRV